MDVISKGPKTEENLRTIMRRIVKSDDKNCWLEELVLRRGVRIRLSMKITRWSVKGGSGKKRMRMRWREDGIRSLIIGKEKQPCTKRI
ncbi:hypothetical protein LINGRAHAP2_LOCUS14209 [Linum grandiflorum]